MSQNQIVVIRDLCEPFQSEFEKDAKTNWKQLDEKVGKFDKRHQNPKNSN